MSAPASDHFQIYQQRRKQLLQALNEQVTLLVRLDMNTAAGNMRRLADETASDNFKVMVVGEFNRGKSTLINAMLGRKVLPAYGVPTTAIINEVKWGQQPAAYLFHLKDGPEGNQRVEQISVDDLDRYVVAADSDGERGKPYEKVVLEWPLDLCRDGVELVDAPGLNADTTHQIITTEYLTHADAVVFVIACDFPFSKSEQDMVAVIRGTLHHEDIFFLCNRIDKVDDDQALVKKRLIQLLSPLTREGTRHIYFVNAHGALQAQINHNEMMLEASGVPQAESDLKEFLATERGRLKLVRPAYDLQDSVQRAREAIRQAEEFSQMQLAELQRRYEEAQQPLHQLSLQVQDISSQLTAFRSSLKLDVSDKARAFFRDLATQPKEWITGWTPENTIGLTNLLSSKRREELIEETVRYLSGKADAAFNEWQSKSLVPFVSSEVQDKLRPRIEARVKAFGAGLDQVKLNLRGAGLKTSFQIGGDAVPMWQRVVGGVGGLLLGDIFSAGFGVAFGVRPMLANAGVAFGIMVASIVLTGGLSAAVIIPALVGASALQAYIRGTQMTDKILNMVADEYSKHITEDRDILAATVTRAVDEQMSLLQNKVEEILETELASVREQVEGELAAKQQGQRTADEKQQQLRQVSAALDAQNKFVVDLVSEYALNQ